MNPKIIESYDKEKIQILKDLWQKIINFLLKDEDPKKILSFLNKCGVIWIDEKEKKVYIWIPNEFVSSQVKKFFNKSLNAAIAEVYNSQFKSSIIIYPEFHSGRNALQVDLKEMMWTTSKKEEKIDSGTKQTLTDYFGILFDPKYKFDNFVVWWYNELAYSAAMQVAQHPWLAYNPFFIYWNVWLGKTHLLQAIWNHIISNHKDKVVVYLPTTKLIDEVIDCVRKNKLPILMKKLDEVDVLVLDDIQFLADKEKTQEIFHNIFNDFHLKKKQIVLSSDRPPKELTSLEPRLRSRFAIWLVADIKKPDFETRVAILKSKLKEKWEAMDVDYLNTIAKYVVSNVRELEWALNIILTKKNLLSREITEDEIRQSLDTLWYSMENAEWLSSGRISNAENKNTRSKVGFSKITEYVANYYNISIYDLKWDSRKKEVSLARQMLMFIAKKYFDWTLEKIGDYFSGKNHATVIYAINNFERQIKNNKKVSNDFSVILEELDL